MSGDEDRELAEHLVRGLHERCTLITFAHDFFGIRRAGSATIKGRQLLVQVTEDEFTNALAVMAVQAEGLWPDRPPRRRAVQLMLVHADEDIDTRCGDRLDLLLTLPEGEVRVRPIS
jgi:hypothetical protein